MILPKNLFLRKKIIVDPALQYGLVSRMVIFVLCTFAAMAVMLFLPLVREMDAVKGQGKPSTDSVSALLYMHEHFWPVALICLVVAIVGVIRVSHRIAGPLVRVKRIMRFVQEGHLPGPLRTRPRDFFKFEVDILNEMVESLGTRIAQLKDTSRELRRDLSACDGIASGEEFAALTATIERLEDQLAEFTVQAEPTPEALETVEPNESEPEPALH